MVAASEHNSNTTRGLLGNFNGIPEDDLCSSDGTLIPTNSSLRDIHYQFGLSWNVSANESLFSYPPGRSHSSFQDPSFVPCFSEPQVANVTDDVRAVCGESRMCLFDVQSTGGNLAIAQQTARTAERVQNITAELNVTVVLCPAHNLSEFAGVRTSIGYFDGSVATLICVCDTVAIGESSSICVNGTWNVPLGDCIPDVDKNSCHKTDGAYKSIISNSILILIGGILLILTIIIFALYIYGIIWCRRNPANFYNVEMQERKNSPSMDDGIYKCREEKKPK